MKLKANCRESLKLKYLIQSLFTWLPSLGALLHNWGIMTSSKVFWVIKNFDYFFHMLAFNVSWRVLSAFVCGLLQSVRVPQSGTFHVSFSLWWHHNGLLLHLWNLRISSTYKIPGISVKMIHSSLWCLCSLYWPRNLIILCFMDLYCNKGFYFRCFYLFQDFMNGAMH